jgi:hypothetical protein
MFYGPTLVDVFRVGVFCGIVEDVVCDYVFGVDIEFVVRCGVREAKKVSYYVVCAVGTVVGKGNDV